MATIQGIANTSSSIEFMISGLTYPDYQYSNFRIELWTESGALVETKNFTSNTSQMYVTRKFTGLPSGQFFVAKAWIRYLQEPQQYIGSVVYSTIGGGGGPVDPGPSLPGAVGAVNAVASTITEGKLLVAWGAATDALYYNVTVYKADGTYIKDDHTILYNIDFTGLTTGLYYYVTVVPWNNEGRGASASSGNVLVSTLVTRPSNWQWDSTKTSGGNINVTAAEWNRFLNSIDDFRKYKKLGDGAYTYASVGTSITAAQYNQARLDISSMGAVPTAAVAGTRIYASQFNDIRDYLNAIT